MADGGVAGSAGVQRAAGGAALGSIQAFAESIGAAAEAMLPVHAASSLAEEPKMNTVGLALLQQLQGLSANAAAQQALLPTRGSTDASSSAPAAVGSSGDASGSGAGGSGVAGVSSSLPPMSSPGAAGSSAAAGCTRAAQDAAPSAHAAAPSDEERTLSAIAQAQGARACAGITAAMALHPSSLAVQLAGATALAQLFADGPQSAEHSRVAAEAGTVEALAAALHTHGHDADVTRACFDALRWLFTLETLDKPHVEAAVAAGCIETAVAALRNHIASPAIPLVLAALFGMSRFDISSRRRAGAAGSVAATMAVLRFPQSAAHELSLLLLVDLMEDTENAAEACDVGALPFLVSALASTDGTVASQAPIAMSRVSVLGVAHRAQAVEHGALEALIAVIGARSGEGVRKHAAVKALFSLVASESGAADKGRAVRAVRAGAKVAIEACLRKHGILMSADDRAAVTARLLAVMAAAAAGADAAAAALLAELEAERPAEQAAPARSGKNKNKKSGEKKSRRGSAGASGSGAGEPAAAAAADAVANSDDEAERGGTTAASIAAAELAPAVAVVSPAEAASPFPSPPQSLPPLPPLPPAPLPPAVAPLPPSPAGALTHAASALDAARALAPLAWAPAPAVLPPLPLWLQQSRMAAATVPAPSSVAVAASPVLPVPHAAPARTMASLEEQLRALMRVQEAEREARLCVICLDAPKDTILQPCSHVCVCGRCAAALKARADGGLCPVCRAGVASHAHVFL